MLRTNDEIGSASEAALFNDWFAWGRSKDQPWKNGDSVASPSNPLFFCMVRHTKLSLLRHLNVGDQLWVARIKREVA